MAVGCLLLTAVALAGCAASARPSQRSHRAGSSSLQGRPPSGSGSTVGTAPRSGSNGSLSGSGPENLLTYGFGNGRDAVGPARPALAGIGRSPIWRRVLSAGVYGQPLVDGSLVIVATEGDFVDAFDVATGKPAWKLSIGNPARQATVQSAPTLAGGCGDIYPLGITGTPVIDAASREIFVAGEVQARGTSGWQGIEHVMVAATFTTTHASIRWTRRIDPVGAGSTYVVAAEQQRASLTLSGGRVYAEFGGLFGDCGSYQGYVVGLSRTGDGPLADFRVPTSREGAIWAPGGAAVGPGGELYVATGNSANQSPNRRFDYGDAVIGLRATADGFGIDSYFAPVDWRALNAGDRDLGSAGPVVLPGGKLIFEIGKALPDGVSTGYLLKAAALGGLGGALYTGTVCPGGGDVFGADASALLTVNRKKVTYIFVPCPSGTVALALGGTPPDPRFSVAWESADGGNGPPILAGGLVWALSTGSNSGGSALYGLDPLTGRLVVHRVTAQVEHFATPGAGAGRIVVATYNGLEAFAPA